MIVSQQCAAIALIVSEEFNMDSGLSSGWVHGALSIVRNPDLIERLRPLLEEIDSMGTYTSEIPSSAPNNIMHQIRLALETIEEEDNLDIGTLVEDTRSRVLEMWDEPCNNQE
jgi:hypothetical protein